MESIYRDETPDYFSEPANFHFKSKLLQTYPLISAASVGDIEHLNDLIELGVNTNCRGDLGTTPLHAAASSGHIEAVKLLLEYGADPSLKTELNHTPLDLARINSNTHIVDLLTNWRPTTYAHLLPQLFSEYVSSDYFENNFSINSANAFGLFPIHVATQRKSSAEVLAFAEAGADIDKQTDDGLQMTALHLSIGQCTFDITRELLRIGADYSIRNGFGYTPFDLAMLMGETKQIFYLYDWISERPDGAS